MTNLQTIKAWCLIYLVISVSGCVDQDNKLLNTLTLAENNRFELETVLTHYKDEPEKLAAAKYLIDNMPGHYSFADTARVERFYDSLDWRLDGMADCSRKAVQDSIVSLCKNHDIENFATVPDIQVISAV